MYLFSSYKNVYSRYLAATQEFVLRRQLKLFFLQTSWNNLQGLYSFLKVKCKHFFGTFWIPTKNLPQPSSSDKNKLKNEVYKMPLYTQLSMCWSLCLFYQLLILIWCFDLDCLFIANFIVIKYDDAIVSFQILKDFRLVNWAFSKLSILYIDQRMEIVTVPGAESSQ